MDELASLATVRALLRQYGIRPRKRWGQNFLINPGILEKIVAAAEISPADTVVEVGPGIGALTARLTALAGHVVAVEIDRSLVALLKERFSACPNLFLVEGDALKADFDALVRAAGGTLPYKVVANLPYYVTTPLLTRLLNTNFTVSLLVVMVQKEVALRLVARPGTKEYGSLSVLAQYRSEAELVTVVSRGSFFPAPAVDSAVVKLRLRSAPPVAVPDEGLFFRVVRAAFGQRRKTLLNALAGAGLGRGRQEWEAVLKQAGIDPQRRGETLDLAAFAAIARVLAEGVKE
ncbi:dimethyladenosine transferase [Thermodesulfitimonas autotrophica]|uniref:Ribosomal RNA small subunit methyltransferase A n=1 Tax=Thermodesulfitimonas autotrophica TaxID=1894989 RepID=A0A3N5AEL8_9THEO|nr:16S rRNA (adenine(1518)-N(6)/adenine(1519)-N(6))-dimethyltransferase RsmA [Thermodesulfitimonas autotrophica]RPF42430.1 dimethyladenosine transferase [Thermodesulfitimonas autotrophica]